MCDGCDFVIENGAVKKYTGPGGDVVIPEGVIAIGASAFRCCGNLKSMAIPESVTSIGASAFRDCDSLSNVVIPGSVTILGDGAFLGCKSLHSMVIPKSMVSIGNWAFADCAGLRSVVIPESVTSMGDWALGGCLALTNVTLQSAMARVLNNIGPTEAHMIVLHTGDITNISEEFRPGAAVGFAEDGRDSTDENGEKYLAYIRSNIAELAQAACGHPALLRLMIREKLIPAKDLETVIAAVQASGNAELMTAMRNYSGTSE